MAAANMNVMIFLFHLIIFALYMFTLIYETLNIPTAPHRKTYAGRFKFLTFWNQLVQTMYFGYSVVNDIFGSNSLPSKDQTNSHKSALQQFRDFIAASIVFPGSMFVTTVFWTLYAIDRELIYPAALDKVFPSWLNHMWHTNILLFLVVERLFIYHKYPSRISGISALLGFALVYQLWWASSKRHGARDNLPPALLLNGFGMFWIAYYANLWVYPVLEVLGWTERLLFLVACWLMMVGCYLVGEGFTSILWR